MSIALAHFPLLPAITSNRAACAFKETGTLSRKARKQSKAQAAIQAALEIAREHAELIAAQKTGSEQSAHCSAPKADTE